MVGFKIIDKREIGLGYLKLSFKIWIVRETLGSLGLERYNQHLKASFASRNVYSIGKSSYY
jgi:hypothetical protein